VVRARQVDEGYKELLLAVVVHRVLSVVLSDEVLPAGRDGGKGEG